MKKLLTLTLTLTLIIGTLCLFSAKAQAENMIWADGYRTITNVYPDSDFQFYLGGDTIDNSSSCPNRFVIRHNDPNYEVKVATILTAWANNKRIKVKYDDDHTGCGTPVSMFKVEN